MKQPFAFDELIAPLTRANFFAAYWNKTFVHLKGTPGRFAGVMNWDDLNTVLETHPPPRPQVRVFRNGDAVDMREFIEGPPGALKLNIGTLVAHLSQGASLVVDELGSVAPRVGEMSRMLQDELQSHPCTNLYAGWSREHAFNLHWDPHDVFVLQLSGRKRWVIHAPTRLHPLADEVEKGLPPGGPPLFDAILNDGDMLYIPRGWWHMAYPLDEPSLHLTFGMTPPNGADFLAWWTQNLWRHPEIRRDIPLDPAARRQFQQKLVEILARDAGRDLVGEFSAFTNAGRRPPLKANLPDAPLAQKGALAPATRLRLATIDRLFIEPEDDPRLAKFFAAGNYWSFRRDLVPAFERLSGRASLSMHELCAGIADPQAISQFAGAIDLLARAGVLLKER